MDDRSAIFGIAGVGVMGLGAALALVSGALRGPDPVPAAVRATEVRDERPAAARASLPDTAARRLRVGPHAEGNGFRRGSELLEAFLWRELPAGADAPPPAEALDFDALIALLPDPYDSHLDWTYDSSLEAIRRAFEKADYVADRFWIPGRDDTVQLPDGMGTVPMRELYPGVILFRATDPVRPRLRLLYLVGEIPTGGIHKAALQTALLERHALLRLLGVGGARATPPAGAPPADVIRIIGPTFSGSASSVLRVVDGWLATRHPDDGTRVQLVSGTATSFRADPTLVSAPRIDFRATVNPDSRLNALLRDSVLERLGIAAGRVALLKESSTVYGRAVAAGSEARHAAAEGDGQAPGAGAMIEISFPLNISSVRAEYERNPEDRPQADLILGGRAASRVPLSLQDAARPRESPPITSRLTAPALDLSLDEILRALLRHDVRAVGVQATDVRDKLFLGELVRQRLRDVQLFTYESSSLYLRREYNHALRGMLVLSTYPLFLESQWWPRVGGGRADRLHFASDGAQGIHNATLILLGHPERVVEYGPPFGAAADSLRPPVWLTVVGARSFLPVRTFAAPGGDPYVAAAGVGGGGGPAGRTPHRESLLAVVSTLLFGAGLLLVSLVSTRQGVAELRALRAHGGWGGAPATARDAGARGAPDTAGAATPATGAVEGGIVRAAPPGGAAGGGIVRAAPLDGAVGAGAGAAAVQPAAPAAWNPAALERLLPGPLQRLVAAMRALPVAAPEYAAFLEVQHGSLLIHRALYTALLLIALGGVIAPPAAVLWGAETHSPAGEGVRAVVLGAAAAAILLTWLMALLVATVRGTTHWMRVFRRGADYALGWQWWRCGQGWLWHAEWLGRVCVMVLGAVYAVLTARYVADVLAVAAGGAGVYEPFAHRALQIGSGVSPLLPLMLTGLGFATWSTWHLQRIQLLLDASVFEYACLRYRGRAPEPRGERAQPPCDLTVRLAGDVRTVRERLFLVVPHAGGLALLCLIGALSYWLLGRFGHTLEALVMPGGWFSLSTFDALLRFSVVGTLMATTWAVYRLVVTWGALQRCLTTVAETPLTAAFERLPGQISRLTRLSLLGTTQKRNRHGQAEAGAVATTAAAQGQYLARIFAANRAAIEEELAEDPELLARVERLSRGDTALAGESPVDQLNELHRALAGLWSREPTVHDIREVAAELAKPDAAERLAGVGTGRRVRRTFSGPEALWLRVAEEMAAVKFVDYVEWVLRHFRRLALFLLLALLITTALLSSYPFQPQSLARLVFLFVLLGTVGALMYVMVQMNRDEVLSRITRTDPGRITWNTTFVLNFALFAVVPLLALVSSEFSSLRGLLFSWLEPLLRQMGSM